MSINKLSILNRSIVTYLWTYRKTPLSKTIALIKSSKKINAH